jgi:hypothetical protein
MEAKLNEQLKHSWRVGCFVSEPYEALVTRERDDRGEDIFGAAYERGHSRPRMWAQYSENYKGACLVFDKYKLDADIRSFCSSVGSSRVHAGNVVYRNPRVLPSRTQPNPLMISVDEIDRLGFGDAVEAHISRHWKDLFFVKSRDWEQEREFRWLVRGDGNEDFYIGIRNSLVGIALGDCFPNPLNVAVGQFAKLNPISVAVMNWTNGFPQPHPTDWRQLLEP